MRKHSKRVGGFPTHSGASFPVVLLLFCFAGGIFAGFFMQRLSAAPASEEVRRYLLAYSDGCVQTVRPTVWEAAFLYFRYPLAVVLLGCSVFGGAAIPLLCAAQGFSLSFAACSFAAAVGGRGVLLALASFGVRALVTIPCTMMLGTLFFPLALCIARGGKLIADGARTRRAAVCFLLLSAGVILELTVVPYLFAAAVAAV